MYYRKRKRATAGFYIAVGVCLVGIGIAAVLTYTKFSKVPALKEPAQESSLAQSEPVRPNGASSFIEKTEPSAAERPGAKTDPPESAVSKPTLEESSNTGSSKPESLPAHVDYDPNLEPESSDSSQDGTAGEPAQSEAPPPQATFFVRPIGTEITKGYSDAPVYSETFRDWRVHKATDYRATRGALVRSISEGTVLKTYSDPYLGNVVEIQHGDYTARYCGLGGTFLCSAGDRVSPGEEIGSVLETPQEIIEGNHLHLEVYLGDEAVDPESLF